MAIEVLVCCVCTEEVTTVMEAWCGQCGRSYHLAQRSDIPGKDCGQVWINEEHLALEFACDACLAPPEQPAGLDDILDAGEGAFVAGLTEDALIAAALAGTIRHRKTGSGVYLFERRDLLALRPGP
ncbi:MAG: hypothetical protein ACKVT1_08705 [Dehalococcoidia bacterium]